MLLPRRQSLNPPPSPKCELDLATLGDSLPKEFRNGKLGILELRSTGTILNKLPTLTKQAVSYTDFLI